MAIVRMSRREAVNGAVLLALAAVLFGSVGPISNLVYRTGMTPWGFAGSRAVLVSLSLLAFAYFGGSWKPLRTISRHDALGLLTLAVMGGTISLVLILAYSRMAVALVLAIY